MLVAQVSESERARTRQDRQYKCCLEQMNGELHQLRAQEQSHQQRYQQQQHEVHYHISVPNHFTLANHFMRHFGGCVLG